MLLSQKALQKVNELPIRMKIAVIIGCSERSVLRYIAENHIILTSYSVLELLRQETGWSDRTILCDAHSTVKTKAI